jgi:hypothetical protein
MYGLMKNDASTVRIDQRVRGVFEDVTDDVTFLRWHVVDEDPAQQS